MDASILEEPSVVQTTATTVDVDTNDKQETEVGSITSTSTQRSRFDALGDLFKDRERATATTERIDRRNFIVVRVDGKGFSKYTAPFKKDITGERNVYFSPDLSHIMVHTAQDLMHHFNAIAAYTQSDEISLLIDRATKPEQVGASGAEPLHQYDGRVMKLATLMAGYASARFNHHAAHAASEASGNRHLLGENVIKRLESGEAMFDARLMEFTPEEQPLILEYFEWRSRYDCARNSRTGFSRAYFKQKELCGVSSVKACEMVHKEKGLRWEDCPCEFRYGVWIKRVATLRTMVNPQTQLPIEVLRKDKVARALDLSGGMHEVNAILFQAVLPAW